MSQYILGIQPGFNELIIDPCLPTDMEGFTVKRKWREAEYEIVVKNPHHKQKADQPTVVAYHPGKQKIEITL